MPVVNPRVPEGLRDLMKGLTKEVLREKPTNIYEFSAHYFETLFQENKDFIVKEYEPAISYENLFQAKERNQIPVALVFKIIPEGLTELIKEFIKAVLRENPKNLYEFAVDYFRHIQKVGNIKNGTIQYTAYENYFNSNERFVFTPYVKCKCGRTFGEGLAQEKKINKNHFSKKKSQIDKVKRPIEKSLAKIAAVSAIKLEISSKCEKDNTAEESKASDEPTAVTLLDSSKKVESMALTTVYDERYITAIYVIQRFFKRCLRNQTLKNSKESRSAQNGESSTQMSEEAAAIIIQRSMRKLFTVKFHKDDKNTSIIPQLENMQHLEEHNDNVSEAASYTSASTVQMSAESTGETTEREILEIGTFVSEEQAVIHTIEGGVEQQNDSAAESKEITDKITNSFEGKLNKHEVADKIMPPLIIAQIESQIVKSNKIESVDGSDDDQSEKNASDLKRDSLQLEQQLTQNNNTENLKITSEEKNIETGDSNTVSKNENREELDHDKITENVNQKLKSHSIDENVDTLNAATNSVKENIENVQDDKKTHVTDTSVIENADDKNASVGTLESAASKVSVTDEKETATAMNPTELKSFESIENFSKVETNELEEQTPSENSNQNALHDADEIKLLPVEEKKNDLHETKSVSIEITSEDIKASKNEPEAIKSGNNASKSAENTQFVEKTESEEFATKIQNMTAVSESIPRENNDDKLNSELQKGTKCANNTSIEALANVVKERFFNDRIVSGEKTQLEEYTAEEPIDVESEIVKETAIKKDYERADSKQYSETITEADEKAKTANENKEHAHEQNIEYIVEDPIDVESKIVKETAIKKDYEHTDSKQYSETKTEPTEKAKTTDENKEHAHEQNIEYTVEEPIDVESKIVKETAIKKDYERADSKEYSETITEADEKAKTDYENEEHAHVPHEQNIESLAEDSKATNESDGNNDENLNSDILTASDEKIKATDEAATELHEESIHTFIQDVDNVNKNVVAKISLSESLEENKTNEANVSEESIEKEQFLNEHKDDDINVTAETTKTKNEVSLSSSNNANEKVTEHVDHHMVDPSENAEEDNETAKKQNDTSDDSLGEISGANKTIKLEESNIHEQNDESEEMRIVAKVPISQTGNKFNDHMEKTVNQLLETEKTEERKIVEAEFLLTEKSDEFKNLENSDKLKDSDESITDNENNHLTVAAEVNKTDTIDYNNLEKKITIDTTPANTINETLQSLTEEVFKDLIAKSKDQKSNELESVQEDANHTENADVSQISKNLDQMILEPHQVKTIQKTDYRKDTSVDDTVDDSLENNKMDHSNAPSKDISDIKLSSDDSTSRIRRDLRAADISLEEKFVKEEQANKDLDMKCPENISYVDNAESNNARRTNSTESADKETFQKSGSTSVNEKLLSAINAVEILNNEVALRDTINLVQNVEDVAQSETVDLLELQIAKNTENYSAKFTEQHELREEKFEKEISVDSENSAASSNDKNKENNEMVTELKSTDDNEKVENADEHMMQKEKLISTTQKTDLIEVDQTQNNILTQKTDSENQVSELNDSNAIFTSEINDKENIKNDDIANIMTQMSTTDEIKEPIEQATKHENEVENVDILQKENDKDTFGTDKPKDRLDVANKSKDSDESSDNLAKKNYNENQGVKDEYVNLDGTTPMETQQQQQQKAEQNENKLVENVLAAAETVEKVTNADTIATDIKQLELNVVETVEVDNQSEAAVKPQENERTATYLYGIHTPRNTPTLSRKNFQKTATTFTIPFDDNRLKKLTQTKQLEEQVAMEKSNDNTISNDRNKIDTVSQGNEIYTKLSELSKNLLENESNTLLSPTKLFAEINIVEGKELDATITAEEAELLKNIDIPNENQNMEIRHSAGNADALENARTTPDGVLRTIVEINETDLAQHVEHKITPGEMNKQNMINVLSEPFDPSEFGSNSDNESDLTSSWTCSKETDENFFSDEFLNENTNDDDHYRRRRSSVTITGNDALQGGIYEMDSSKIILTNDDESKNIEKSLDATIISNVSMTTKDEKQNIDSTPSCNVEVKNFSAIEDKLPKSIGENVYHTEIQSKSDNNTIPLATGVAASSQLTETKLEENFESLVPQDNGGIYNDNEYTEKSKGSDVALTKNVTSQDSTQIPEFSDDSIKSTQVEEQNSPTRGAAKDQQSALSSANINILTDIKDDTKKLPQMEKQLPNSPKLYADDINNNSSSYAGNENEDNKTENFIKGNGEHQLESTNTHNNEILKNELGKSQKLESLSDIQLVEEQPIKANIKEIPKKVDILGDKIAIAENILNLEEKANPLDTTLTKNCMDSVDKTVTDLKDDERNLTQFWEQVNSNSNQSLDIPNKTNVTTDNNVLGETPHSDKENNLEIIRQKSSDSARDDELINNIGNTNISSEKLVYESKSNDIEKLIDTAKVLDSTFTRNISTPKSAVSKHETLALEEPIYPTINSPINQSTKLMSKNGKPMDEGSTTRSEVGKLQDIDTNSVEEQLRTPKIVKNLETSSLTELQETVKLLNATFTKNVSTPKSDEFKHEISTSEKPISPTNNSPIDLKLSSKISKSMDEGSSNNTNTKVVEEHLRTPEVTKSIERQQLTELKKTVKPLDATFTMDNSTSKSAASEHETIILEKPVSPKNNSPMKKATNLTSKNIKSVDEGTSNNNSKLDMKKSLVESFETPDLNGSESKFEGKQNLKETVEPLASTFTKGNSTPKGVELKHKVPVLEKSVSQTKNSLIKPMSVDEGGSINTTKSEVKKSQDVDNDHADDHHKKPKIGTENKEIFKETKKPLDATYTKTLTTLESTHILNETTTELPANTISLQEPVNSTISSAIDQPTGELNKKSRRHVADTLSEVAKGANLLTQNDGHQNKVNKQLPKEEMENCKESADSEDSMDSLNILLTDVNKNLEKAAKSFDETFVISKQEDLEYVEKTITDLKADAIRLTELEALIAQAPSPPTSELSDELSEEIEYRDGADKVNLQETMDVANLKNTTTAENAGKLDKTSTESHDDTTKLDEPVISTADSTMDQLTKLTADEQADTINEAKRIQQTATVDSNIEKDEQKIIFDKAKAAFIIQKAYRRYIKINLENSKRTEGKMAPKEIIGENANKLANAAQIIQRAYKNYKANKISNITKTDMPNMNRTISLEEIGSTAENSLDGSQITVIYNEKELNAAKSGRSLSITTSSLSDNQIQNQDNEHLTKKRGVEYMTPTAPPIVDHSEEEENNKVNWFVGEEPIVRSASGYNITDALVIDNSLVVVENSHNLLASTSKDACNNSNEPNSTVEPAKTSNVTFVQAKLVDSTSSLFEPAKQLLSNISTLKSSDEIVSADVEHSKCAPQESVSNSLTTLEAQIVELEEVYGLSQSDIGNMVDGSKDIENSSEIEEGKFVEDTEECKKSAGERIRDLDKVDTPEQKENSSKDNHLAEKAIRAVTVGDDVTDNIKPNEETTELHKNDDEKSKQELEQSHSSEKAHIVEESNELGNLNAVESFESAIEMKQEEKTENLTDSNIAIVKQIINFLETERGTSNIDKDQTVSNNNSTETIEIKSAHSLEDMNYLTQFINLERKYWESDIPYTKLEKPCTKETTYLAEPVEDDAAQRAESSLSEVAPTADFDLETEQSSTDSLESMTKKLHEADVTIERMQLRRASTARSNSNDDGKTTHELSFDEPIIKSMQELQENRSSELEDEEAAIILNRFQREDTRESSAQSDAVVFGEDHSPENNFQYEFEDSPMMKFALQRVHTIAGDDPKSLFKSVTIDDTVQYIEPPECDTTATSGSSFCLDDDVSENIRKKMMAYSLSEADSDFFDNEAGDATTRLGKQKLHKDDFNISTALVDLAGTSTDTESTIVSAATKIQAGARGFLTRKRLRRASVGTKSTLPDNSKASFGNAAISESLERLIEEEAAKKIQHAYRKHYRQKDLTTSTVGEKYVDRRQVTNTDDEEDAHVLLSFESTLAARRLTLQRGDALRNDSTPDDDNGNGNVKPLGRISNESDKVLKQETRNDLKQSVGKRYDTEGSSLESNSMHTHPRSDEIVSAESVEVEQIVESQSNSEDPALDVSVTDEKIEDTLEKSSTNTLTADANNKKKIDNELKWISLRQNSMPVQIEESEVFRVIPKHMRKRNKSAESQMKKRLRVLKD